MKPPLLLYWLMGDQLCAISVPMAAQNFLGATLGRLAEALGYKAVYPQYVE